MTESWESRIARWRFDRHFNVELKDATGEVHAIIEKIVNVRKRRSA